MKDKEDALPTLSSLRLDGLFNKREKRNGLATLIDSIKHDGNEKEKPKETQALH